MVALTLSFTVATPARADDPGRYEKFFSFESSSYSITDRYGTFDAQVSIFNPGHTMAWSFQMAPQIQLLVAGTMACTAQGWDGRQSGASRAALLNCSAKLEKFDFEVFEPFGDRNDLSLGPCLVNNEAIIFPLRPTAHIDRRCCLGGTTAV